MFGEWKANTVCGAAGGVTGEAEVTIKVSCISPTVEEVRLLVDAAPELLEKLVFCRRYIAELASIPGHKASVSATLPGIDAAIAKAKGGQG